MQNTATNSTEKKLHSNFCWLLCSGFDGTLYIVFCWIYCSFQDVGFNEQFKRVIWPPELGWMPLQTISLTNSSSTVTECVQCSYCLHPCNRSIPISLPSFCLTYHPKNIFKQASQNANSKNQSSRMCFFPTATLHNKLNDCRITWMGGDKSLLALSFQTLFSMGLHFNHDNLL